MRSHGHAVASHSHLQDFCPRLKTPSTITRHNKQEKKPQRRQSASFHVKACHRCLQQSLSPAWGLTGGADSGNASPSLRLWRLMHPETHCRLDRLDHALWVLSIGLQSRISSRNCTALPFAAPLRSGPINLPRKRPCQGATGAKPSGSQENGKAQETTPHGAVTSAGDEAGQASNVTDETLGVK